MRTFGVSHVAVLAVLAVMDGLWLGLAGHEFYKARLAQFLLDEPAWAVAVVFHLIHAGGIAVFAVPPALAASSWVAPLLYGAAFGICVCAAYDLTNLATLRGRPRAVSVVDLAWDAAATAAATRAAYLAARPA